MPQWARTSAPPSAELLADVAEWRAAMQVPEADQHPTGPPQISVAAARWQRALDERAASDRSPAMAEWAPLLHTTAPDTARDPFTPELAEQLAAISRTGLDARAILRLATSDGPLPDDHAAAALWWRIQRHLTPDPGDVGAAVDVNAATDAVFDGVTQRWAPLAKRLDPRLTAQRDWLLLAEVLQEVHDAGYDVLEVTRQLVEQAPLDGSAGGRPALPPRGGRAPRSLGQGRRHGARHNPQRARQRPPRTPETAARVLLRTATLSVRSVTVRRRPRSSPRRAC